ncbi:MAG: Do family serine endopeptidase [Bacteroidales bacterium]|nr:Do family serine endopeptidase [Bacteroidales bacterium]
MKKSRKLAFATIASSVLLSATTAFGVTKATINDQFISSEEQAEGFVKTATRGLAGHPDFTEVAEHTINSVVSIKNYANARQQQYQDWGGFDPFEFFFGPGMGGQQRKQQQPKQKSEGKPQLRGSGSGVIISADGYIVTNNHVVDGADKLTVTLNNNDEYSARVIGTDANTDLALIKITPEKGKNLEPIVFGNSDDVKVGEWAIAVGNPFGFNSSVTAGIISAKGRGVNEGNVGIKSFIQHDAAVNPGNSGGALVNTNGDLIGINTMIYSQTGNYAGISFAVPSNIVKKIVTDLKQYGTVQRAVLGISYEELNAEKAKEHKITATKSGIYVAKVSDDGAAMEAGIKEGDVIVKLNGADVKNSGELQEQMSKLRPGDKATISYYRDNKLKNTTVTFKNDQGTTSITKSSDFTSLGCAFMALSSKDKEELNISNGVKVTALKDGKFKANGIKNGLVITAINDQAVNSSDDVEEIYNTIMKSKDADKVMVIKGFYETGRKVYIAVNIADEEE